MGASASLIVPVLVVNSFLDFSQPVIVYGMIALYVALLVAMVIACMLARFKVQSVADGTVIYVGVPQQGGGIAALLSGGAAPAAPKGKAMPWKESTVVAHEVELLNTYMSSKCVVASCVRVS